MNLEIRDIDLANQTNIKHYDPYPCSSSKENKPLLFNGFKFLFTVLRQSRSNFSIYRCETGSQNLKLFDGNLLCKAEHKVNACDCDRSQVLVKKALAWLWGAQSERLYSTLVTGARSFGSMAASSEVELLLLDSFLPKIILGKCKRVGVHEINQRRQMESECFSSSPISFQARFTNLRGPSFFYPKLQDFETQLILKSRHPCWSDCQWEKMLHYADMSRKDAAVTRLLAIKN